MRPAQWKCLRACLAVASRPHRTFRLRDVARELGMHINAVIYHVTRLRELGLVARHEVGKTCDHGVYVLRCSFILFR